MTIMLTPEKDGAANCAALELLCRRLRAALAPYRGKDAAVDRYFAIVEAPQQAEAERAGPSPAADK